VARCRSTSDKTVVTQLLDVFSFVSVLLRGAALACQTLILGGAIFNLWILRPLDVVADAKAADIFRSTRRLICWCALVFAVIQGFYLAADSLLLIGSHRTGLAWRCGRELLRCGPGKCGRGTDHCSGYRTP
jgi:hypothetical protein